MTFSFKVTGCMFLFDFFVWHYKDSGSCARRVLGAGNFN